MANLHPFESQATESASPIYDLPPELLLPILGDVVRSSPCTLSSRGPRTKSSRNKTHLSSYRFSIESKDLATFGLSSKISAWYYQTLGDFIFKEAPVVFANVVDFQFDNLKAYLKQLKEGKDSHLPELDENGEPLERDTLDRLPDFHATMYGAPGRRTIIVSHIITTSFPDNLDRLVKFTKYANGMVGENGEELCIQHRVVECEDDGVVERLLVRLEDGCTSPGNQFDHAMMALRRYHQDRMNAIRTVKSHADVYRGILVTHIADQGEAMAREAAARERERAWEEEDAVAGAKMEDELEYEVEMEDADLDGNSPDYGDEEEDGLSDNNAIAENENEMEVDDFDEDSNDGSGDSENEVEEHSYAQPQYPMITPQQPFTTMQNTYAAPNNAYAYPGEAGASFGSLSIGLGVRDYYSGQESSHPFASYFRQ